MDKKRLKTLKKELLEKQKADKLAKRSAQIQARHNTCEEELFREAMSGVTPLQHDKAYHEAERPQIKSNRANFSVNSFEEEIQVQDTLSDAFKIEAVDNEEVLSFCKNGVQKSVFKKLRTGSYRISDELDLHGCTLKQAKKILLYYLQEAVQFEACCVRIIHGKGHRSRNNKPVLKTHLNHWLREHQRVLAFHSAKEKDGGTGALYVLLKTR